MTGTAWVWLLALLALWFWANRRWFAKLDRNQRERGR